MSTPEEQLRQKLIAEALKSKVPMAALDPTSSFSNSLDEAASAFSKRLPPADGIEQSGVLFSGDDGKYQYSIPVTQKHREAFALQAQSGNGHKMAGIFHVHPGDDDLGQIFSPEDVEMANKLKVPSYVLFLRNGQIRKYTPGVTGTRKMKLPGSFSYDKVADGDPLADPQIMTAGTTP